MTIKQLSQLYYLNIEIANNQRRLERLRAEAGCISSPGADSLPHGSGSRHGKTERLATDLAYVQSVIEKLQARCIEERKVLNDYIANIPDNLTRQIFMCRFVDGMTWSEVADTVGGKNTAGSVKKRCQRYLDANKE